MGMALPVEVLRLQTEISRMQRASARVTALPVHDALAPLFPEGGLRPGAVYTLDPAASLLLALLAEPSRAGSWCAVVGMPELSAEAAEAAGVDLSRFALVPEPGDRWLAAVSAIAEVFPMVAVRPAGSPRDAEVARLTARLRDRGGVLLVTGPWPQAEATLHLEDPVWSGLGEGHGLLTARTVTVSSSGRRSPVPKRVRVQLPGPQGAPVAVPRPALVPAVVPVPAAEERIDAAAAERAERARAVLARAEQKTRAARRGLAAVG
ncbi:hypothetical protein QMO46_12205 [Microbacterium barkeri]|uniref:hypothetical protein n=1 Tax=Microbacterium barkeri TaxID=33917 RepID=UPI0024AF54BC|nr:hypothetical protein [Microbacterium barkeri]MDI6944252.1 hypothetical protein [Microbacterium barkeri]